jgi:hypothetical protein
VGYDPKESAAAVVNSPLIGASGVTLVLSDSTQITFTNLTSTDALTNKVFYG